MQYNWYNLFNLTEWLATGLVSRTLSVNLDNDGAKEILITQGNETALTFDDVFLILNFNGNNPYARDGRAVYLDDEQNVWIGIQVES